ncbi:hypothetical protein PCASD_10906 [Puccinia coronata f. sp. avenae]|uniref:Uncharacterized protein n=1 Tax=Puccinia coronata f. sp. avenae TaxID=200324 RepID=A0A2N5U1U6_9BASI|nr:hypothetical protein PCASD_10906 [Puccinia coronata f. sp. avenae]
MYLNASQTCRRNALGAFYTGAVLLRSVLQGLAGAGTHLNGEPVNRDRDRDRANASSNLDLFNFIYYCCPQSSSSYHTSPTAHRPPRAPHH